MPFNAIVKTPLCDTARRPSVPVSLLDAVLDRLFAKVHWTHVEPGVPGANFIGVVEDVAKAIVNHVTEAYINVLRPKLTQSRSCVCPNSIIASYMLFPRRSITPDNLLH